MWLSAALVLKLAAMLAFVAAFRAVYCDRLAWRLSAQIATAELAANVLLPTGGAGGLALGAWALQRGGMPTAHIARRTVAFFLITSSVNFIPVILAGALLALGIAGSAPPALALGPAALATATVLAVVALPRVLPARAAHGRLLRRLTTISATLADGIRDAVALVRSGRPLLIAGAVGYMAFDVATLAAAFHALGSAPAVTLVLAYTVGQLGGLIPVPGGRWYRRRTDRRLRYLRNSGGCRDRRRPRLPRLPARPPRPPRHRWVRPAATHSSPLTCPRSAVRADGRRVRPASRLS